MVTFMHLHYDINVGNHGQSLLIISDVGAHTGTKKIKSFLFNSISQIFLIWCEIKIWQSKGGVHNPCNPTRLYTLMLNPLNSQFKFNICLKLGSQVHVLKRIS